MPKFVCPLCEDELIEDNEQALIGEAMDHMIEEHDKDNIDDEYIKEDIEAH